MLDLLFFEIDKISSLTDSDYISIVSSFEVMTDNSLKCSMCKSKYRGSPERQAKLFEQKLCKTVIEKPRFVYMPVYNMLGYSKINYMTCTANLQSGQAMSLINSYKAFEDGTMPYSGGLMEQPSKFVEIMDLVHNLIESKKTEQEEKLKKYRR